MGGLFRGRKVLRIVLPGIALLLLLTGLVLYAAVRADLFSPVIQKIVLPQLEKMAGREVRVSESRLHLFPTYWSVKAFAVSGGKEGGPLLRAAEVRVYLSPLPLLRKELRISRIEVTRPELHLIRYADGSDNFSGLFPPHRRDWEVGADRISIREGGVIFEDRLEDRRFQAATVEALLRLQIPQRRIEAEFHGLGEVRGWGRHVKDLRLEGKIAADPQKGIRVDRLTAAAPGGSRIRLAGEAGRIHRSGDEKDRPWRLRLEGETRLSLAELKPVLFPKKKGSAGAGGFVEGSGMIQGTVPDLEGEGNFAMTDAVWERVPYGGLSGKIAYAAGELRFTDLKGRLLQGEISGEGALRLRGPRVYAVHVKGVGIHPGDLLIRRLPKGVRPAGETIWDGEMTIHGIGRNMRALQGEGNFTTRFPGGTMAGSVRLGEGGSLAASFAGEGEEIARMVQLPRFPVQGKVSFEGTAAGTLSNPVVSGTVRLAGVRVKESPLDEVVGEFQYSRDLLEVSRLEILQGEAAYRARGRILFSAPYAFSNPFFDADAEVVRGDPGAFVAFFYRKLPLEMAATGKLHFEGDRKDFRGTADLEVSAGSAYGQPFDRGRVAVDLERHRIVFRQVRAERGDSVLEGTGWIGFDGTFAARLESPRMALQEMEIAHRAFPRLAGTGAFRIEGEGSFRDPKIRGEGEAAKLFFEGKDMGRAAFSLTETREGVRGTASLADGTVTASGGIDWSPGFPVTLGVEIREAKVHPILAAWKPDWFSPLTLTATGRVDLEGRLSSPRRIRVSASVPDLRGIYRDYAFENDGPLQLSYGEEGFRFDGAKFKGEGTSITLVGGVVPFERIQLFVTGEADLRLLSLLAREIEFSKGKAYLALMVRGAWNDPSIQGGLSIREGTFRSKTLDQGIEGGEMAFFFNGKQIVLESFEGRIGGGTLKGSGKIDIRRFLPAPEVDRFGLVLEVAHAVFRYPEGLTSRLSGTLVFQGSSGEKDLKGEIRIDRAAYERRIELRSMILELRRARGEAGQEGGIPFLGDTRLDLHLVGKQDIWVNNNLAKFPLQVDLILKGTLDRPQVFGNIAARDGTMIFRRNDFKILSATADFITPDIVRPVLDIHARTEIRGYRIDLRLTGTVDRFDLSLQSEPELSETDILALLTVGQTATEVAEARTEIGVTEASVLLAGPLQERVEEKVQKLTGVDRFQVDPYYSGSRSAGGARLTVGKRLMDERLYVTYTTSPAAEEDLIKMEYLLGKNMMLVGERDENGRVSGDLQFRFEFR